MREVLYFKGSDFLKVTQIIEGYCYDYWLRLMLMSMFYRAIEL